MNIGERLKKVRGAMPQEEMAKALGVHKNTVANYEKGGRWPDAEYLMKVVEARPDVDAGWLLTGRSGSGRDRGVMTVDETQAQWHTHRDLKPDSRRQDDKFSFIPLYNVSASAGGGAIVDQEQVVDVLAFKSEWIRTHLNATQQDLYLIHVEGESMEPTLRPGDVILVDHREAEKLPSDGIYVVRMDDSLLVKRLQRLPGNQVRVSSDNAAYQPFMISMAQQDGEFDIVGRVVWCGRRM